MTDNFKEKTVKKSQNANFKNIRIFSLFSIEKNMNLCYINKGNRNAVVISYIDKKITMYISEIKKSGELL